MTYKLPPALGKIRSPIILEFPDGTRREYQDGKAAISDVFDRAYQVEIIQAIEGHVDITLKERQSPEMKWIGEEALSFF